MGERPDDSVRDKGAIGSVADVLQLATAAIGDVPAHRRDMIGPWNDRHGVAIEDNMVADSAADDKAAVGSGTIAARRQTDNQFGQSHQQVRLVIIDRRCNKPPR